MSDIYEVWRYGESGEGLEDGNPLEKIANTGQVGRRRRRATRVDEVTGDELVGGRRVDDIVEELGGLGAGSEAPGDRQGVGGGSPLR